MTTGRLARLELTHPSSAGRLARLEVTAAPVTTKGRLARLELATAPGTGRLARLEVSAPVALLANAGNPQVDLEPWSVIALAGTESGGTSTSRAWRQVSGPTVTLTGTSTARVSYEAPGTLAGGTVVFGYTVTGSNGVPSTEATVTHTVLPATERAVVGGVEVPLRVQTATS